MIRNMHKHWTASAVAVLTSVGLLSACGGSGGESLPAAGGSPTLSGIAAVGKPLTGATVELQCAAGKPANAITTASGAWSTPATGITLPCAIQVSGGKVDGIDNGTSLHSVATATGINNVTTLTTLLTSLMAGQDPAAWFAEVKASPAKLGIINAALRNGALAQLAELLKTLPTPLELPAGFDPVTTQFVADPKTDKFDQLLEKLAANNIPLAQIIAQSIEKTPTGLTLSALSGFGGDVVGGILQDTHEIPAYDPASKRLFVVNGSGAGSVEVWDIADPKSPKQVGTLLSAAYGSGLGGFNSVAIHNGVVALAIQANPKTDNGVVAFVKASDLSLISKVTVGALPDMVTFSPDGRYALTANEGEPSGYGAGYADPEGSISVIDVADITKPVVKTADFTAFNSQIDALRMAGVRIFGPNATVAMDLEPEYVSVSADSKTAYVTLQENNAVAVVDIATAKVTAIRPLGFKDHSIAGFGMDASDEDGGTNTNSGSAKLNIATVPVKGMYLPDGIANFTIGGATYLLTANEGDARADWPGFNEETRVRAYCATGGMDLSVFGASAANFLFDSSLGRLRITSTPNGGLTGKNASGQCNELYAFGGRSFTIWNAADGKRVYDSGDAFETITAGLAGKPGFDFTFNAGHDAAPDALDARSANKGPEPESVVVQRFGTKVYAFIGLERVGGVMVYDVTDPKAAKHVSYINTRLSKNADGVAASVIKNANGDDGVINGGDRGPEGMIVIPAAKSPNGKPLLVVSNEISGTTRLFEINLAY